MKTALRLAAPVAFLAVLTFVYGCQDTGRDDTVPFFPGERPGEVTVYRDIQFDDIPVPVEYSLVRSKSHSYQGSRFRTGSFYYEGRLDAAYAIDFYLHELPKSGWALEKNVRKGNYTEMRFRKGPEQLIVVVHYGSWGSLTEIQLDNIEQNDLLLKGKLKAEH